MGLPSFRNVSGMFPVGVGMERGVGPAPTPGQRVALGARAARARPGGGGDGGAWAGRRGRPRARVQRGGRRPEACRVGEGGVGMGLEAALLRALASRPVPR